MNRATVLRICSIWCACCLVNAPAATWASSARSGSLFLEYYSGDDSDRDIRVGSFGMDGSSEWFRLLSLSRAAHLIVTRGTRTVATETGIEERDADTWGLGMYSVLRLGPHLGPITPFVEAGPGLSYTFGEFPPGGTRWNFTQRYGYGASLRLYRDLLLGISFRRLHVSNGKGTGDPRNPAFDGTGVLIELRR